ncbi:outer membrane protein [Sphingomonas sp. CJ20]
MRTKILAAALIASSAIAAPAFAQSADSGFTGPRAEAVLGWDHVGDDSTAGGSRDGLTYGGQIGYDVQAGSAILGVEGEVTGSTTRDTANNVLVAGDRLRAKAGRDLYVGARAGFLASPQAMIYVKGGYTNARFDTTYDSAATGRISDHDNVDGWRVGAGTEYKLNDKVYVKAEYRYSKYNDDKAGIDAHRHQVLGGVGVRF